MTAFVLGNGISRSEVNINRLLELGQVYGCNALYRTHTPTVLVATDTPIATEIQNSGYSLLNRFYTRKPIPDRGALEIPRMWHGYSSGQIATAIAAEETIGTIYLIGFDLGPTESGKFNNVYAGTQFYKPSSAIPTYTGNWVDQLKRIMREFSNRKFCRVMGPTTAQIPEFTGLVNLTTVDLDDFILRINR
jgi:hypothetical protein